MVINPNILRRDTVALLKDIDAQIEVVRRTALMQGIPLVEVREAGGWVMPPLLQAKATAMQTLVLLQEHK